MKPKTFISVRNIPLLVSRLNQINPFHAILSYLKTHSNIILPSRHRSSVWSLSFRFSHQKKNYVFVVFSIRSTCSANLIKCLGQDKGLR